ncbi:MAG: hypothetical protein JO309_13480 [Pseudonocardiales bacterium]|nr:hypothetical protein [Pseudonocardiales bacterium]
MRAAYRDRSLVTRVGPRHADHAGPGERPVGRPTSSATLPGLIVQMLRQAHIGDNTDVLDVGTGSGYGCAVLAHRLGTSGGSARRCAARGPPWSARGWTCQWMACCRSPPRTGCGGPSNAGRSRRPSSSSPHP